MDAAHVPYWDSRAAVIAQTKSVGCLKPIERVILARRMWAALRHAETLTYRESLVADFDALLKRAAAQGTFGALMAGLDQIDVPR